MTDNDQLAPLTRADLTTMTPEEIVTAHENGDIDHLTQLNQ